MPYYTPGGEGAWPRHVTEGWMSIWDLAKPVIAQVHGYCLAGASELATGCDLVYMAEDAQMGYPAVRFGVPDMHFHPWFLGMRKAMEMMLTGDSITGIAGGRARLGQRRVPGRRARRARARGRAAGSRWCPTELLQLNKRVVHRQMDAMGLRAGIRAGTELCALGTHTEAMRKFIGAARERGLTNALQERDAPFGDYRTAGDAELGLASRAVTPVTVGSSMFTDAEVDRAAEPRLRVGDGRGDELQREVRAGLRGERDHLERHRRRVRACRRA